MFGTAVLSLISLLHLGVLADEAPFYSNAKYNGGDYGKYVTQTFKSNPKITDIPVVNFMKPFTNCDDGSFLFMAPRGNEPDPTPMLLDATGSLVWAAEQVRRHGDMSSWILADLLLALWRGLQCQDAAL